MEKWRRNWERIWDWKEEVKEVEEVREVADSEERRALGDSLWTRPLEAGATKGSTGVGI